MTVGPPIAGLIFDKVNSHTHNKGYCNNHCQHKSSKISEKSAANIADFCQLTVFWCFQVGSYIPAFIAAGIPPIVGSLLMIVIRFYFWVSYMLIFLRKLPGSCLLLWKIWTNRGRRKVLTQRTSFWRTEGGRRGGWRRRWRRRRRCWGGRGAVWLDRNQIVTCNAIVNSSKCVSPFKMVNTRTLQEEYIWIV